MRLVEEYLGRCLTEKPNPSVAKPRSTQTIFLVPDKRRTVSSWTCVSCGWVNETKRSCRCCHRRKGAPATNVSYFWEHNSYQGHNFPVYDSEKLREHDEEYCPPGKSR